MAVLLSILLYAFGLVAAVAALALIRPISWLGLRTRRRAFVAWFLASAVGVGTLVWPTHETRVASPVSRLDQIVPVYQFSEVHENHRGVPRTDLPHHLCRHRERDRATTDAHFHSTLRTTRARQPTQSPRRQAVLRGCAEQWLLSPRG